MIPNQLVFVKTNRNFKKIKIIFEKNDENRYLIAEDPGFFVPAYTMTQC